jgi:succinate dehydrogenase/fumarate reductase flavoprotein subunit
VSDEWPPGEDSEGWDAYADVVVVGSGASGMAAALAAADGGCRVVVLERAEHPGGTTAKSGGVFWIPNNPLMRAEGMEDPRDDALRYMARLSYPHRYWPDHATLGLTAAQLALIEAFYDRGAEMVEAFIAMGAMDPVVERSIPDYHADLPEDKAPYGRHLRPRDIPPQTVGTGGDVLVATMRAAAEALGVQVRFGHRVVEVLRNDSGDVVGVEAHAGPRTTLVRAGRAVVFASGGFTHDADLATQYLRGPIMGGCATDGATGDFVRIGIRLGADLANMSHAWWSETVLESALRLGPTLKDVWLPFGDSMILVNKYGRRVVNEKMVYNERAQVHFEWSATAREYPNLLTFMIYDDAVANAPGPWSSRRQPVPLAGEDEFYVITGATWRELERNLAARLAELAPHTGGVALAPDFGDELQSTVQRFNGFAAAGHDLDYGRGETPIQVAWGGPPREEGQANPTMYPFSPSGPYHAIILGPGALDTKGGPRINPDAQVLDTTGAPIPGLYGAGNCIAAPSAQAYWSGGATIGPALTFGYIAGRGAAQEPHKCL